VSGAGGYELHPQLKAEADGALNEGVESRYFAAEHGFLAVHLTSGALVVDVVRAADGRVVHSHTIRKGV
jgi:hypothetical protein